MKFHHLLPYRPSTRTIDPDWHTFKIPYFKNYCTLLGFLGLCSAAAVLLLVTHDEIVHLWNVFHASKRIPHTLRSTLWQCKHVLHAWRASFFFSAVTVKGVELLME